MQKYKNKPGLLRVIRFIFPKFAVHLISINRKSLNMTTKDKILRALWILIAVIVVAAIVCLLVFRNGTGIFLAVCGGFLVLNVLVSVFLIKRNFR